jgi:O-antigen/teichoic acid export membrane protein
MDPEVVEEAVEVAEATEPVAVGPKGSDQRVILGNTGQNVLGLAIGAVATFGAQVIMTQRLGDRAYGVVTLTTQFAFIAAALTRFGMDVANVRLVAILAGRGEGARSRALVRRAGLIATAVSVPFGVVAWALAPWLAETFFSGNDAAVPAFRAAAVTVPFAALAFTYMGATRGLKIMRYTLYSQWTAQPIGWIVFTLGFWAVWAATAGRSGRRGPSRLRSPRTGGRRRSAASPARSRARASLRNARARCCASAPSAPPPRSSPS